MRRREKFFGKRFGTAALLGAALFGAVGNGVVGNEVVEGAEDWRRFLDELNARGYDDVALTYLKTFQETGTAPEELANELDLRLGLATLQTLSNAPANARDGLVAQARTTLERFLAENPDSPSTVDANSALASLDENDGARALAELEKATGSGSAADGSESSPNGSTVNGSTANGSTASDAASDALRTKARTAFSDEKNRLDAAIQTARERAKALQGDPNADADETLRAQATFLDLTIRAAAVRAQIGRTFPEGSDERKTELEKARATLGKVYSTYQKFAGAFKARYLEAEAAFDLGDLDGAATLSSELAVLPAEPQFFVLKTQNLLLFSKIALRRQNPPELMALVKKFNDWTDVDKLPKAFYASDEGLRVRLAAVRATIALERLRLADKEAFADAGRKTFTDANDPTYKLFDGVKKTKGSNQIVLFAFKNACFVVDAGGPRGLEAEELLKDPLFEGLDRENFAFGKKSANGSDSPFRDVDRTFERMNQARQDLAGASPDAVAEARRRFDDAARAAFDACKSALDSLDDATPADDADRLRLKFAVVCFSTKKYDDAFATADAVVEGRPDFPEATRAATVALRAIRADLAEKRAQGATAEELDAAGAKLAEYADRVVERWGADSADAGAVAVVQEANLAKSELAIDRGDVDAARALLESIPADSPERADAELRLGASLWRAWNERKATVDANDADAETGSDSSSAPTDAAALDALLNGARQALFDGLERKLTSARGVSEDDFTAIYSTLLLAQIFARGDDADSAANAEKWLTHPVVGALTVVEKKLDEAARNADSTDEAAGSDAGSDAASDEADFLGADFQMATLALALELTTRNVDRLADADALATRLETLAERSPENASKPTGVYLRLGRSLEERLTALQTAIDAGDESKKAELDATTKGFESFLKRVSERDAGTKYGSLRWVADSFLSLGRGLSAGSRDVPPPEAIAYFQSAGRTYQTILRKIDADPSFAPTPTTRLSVSLRIVETLRAAGAYRKAFDQAKALVKDSPNNLDVQLEIARTLQDWGRQEPNRYLTAIVGGAPDAKGRNVVWGWNGIIGKLAPLVGKDEKFRAAFFDAYLSKTRCRYLYARRLTGAELDKAARDAENDLRRLYQTRPDLGGAATFAKFDSAFKNFQKLRGVDKPQGLRAAAKSTADANGTAPAAPSDK